MPVILKCLVAAAVVAVASFREAAAQELPTNNARERSPDGMEAKSAGRQAADIARAGDSQDRTIYMVIQTESTMSKEELRAKFERARKVTPDCSVGALEIEAINQSTYVLLKSIVQSGVIPPSQTNQGAVVIKPMESENGAWWIDLKSSTKYLESATIKVGAPNEEITMKAEPKSEATAALRYHSPGVYVLKVPPGRSAKSATLVLTDDADGDLSKPVELNVDLPDLGRCYLVTLKDVEGDTSTLYATLRDKTKIPNPIKGLEDADAAAFVVASFREILAKPLVFKEEAIQLTFPKPASVEPKRMWMRFPLTKAEQQAAIEELDSKFSGDGFRTVPAWIRQNRVGERLTPEGAAGWFELPWDEDHQAYERTLSIDTKAWQERLANNRDFMGQNAIMLYEFEGEDGSPEIIKQDDQEDPKYYRSLEVPGWLTGLSSATTVEK
jgi:hypothetical protein